MPITNPTPQPRSHRTKAVIAFTAVFIAGLLTYFLTTRAAPHDTQNTPYDLTLLQQQPTLGANGTRYDIVIDFECPYCDQFLSGPAYATILEQAHAGNAQLNVTAAAFLNERSHIKGNVYNCVADIAGPAAAIQLIPDLKTPGGDTNYWNAHAIDLGANHVDRDTLQACTQDGALQERANTAFKTTGIPGVPAVFINNTQTPWSQVQPN